jgi:hypothetical protein
VPQGSSGAAGPDDLLRCMCTEQRGGDTPAILEPPAAIVGPIRRGDAGQEARHSRDESASRRCVSSISGPATRQGASDGRPVCETWCPRADLVHTHTSAARTPVTLWPPPQGPRRSLGDAGSERAGALRSGVALASGARSNKTAPRGEGSVSARRSPHVRSRCPSPLPRAQPHDRRWLAEGADVALSWLAETCPAVAVRRSQSCPGPVTADPRGRWPTGLRLHGGGQPDPDTTARTASLVSAPPPPPAGRTAVPTG